MKKLLYYAAITAVIVLSIVIKLSWNTTKFVVGSYTVYTIRSTAMQEVIPEGSLVVVQHTDPQDLDVGELAAYARKADDIVTSRIVMITEKYLNTDARGFRFQAEAQSEPEASLIPAANVLGRVVWTNYALGRFCQFLVDVWVYLVAAFVVIRAFQRYHRRRKREEAEEA